MSEPAAIVPASYTRLSTLADGTVRVVIDVEPRHRAEAFAIFTEPGVPLAVARLQNEAAVAADTGQAVPDQTDAVRTPPAASQGAGPLAASSGPASDLITGFVNGVFGVDAPKRKHTLAEHVAFTCYERSFQEYLAELYPNRAPALRCASGKLAAADVVKNHCGVRSRKAIIEGTEAGDAWLNLRAGYHQWQREKNARVVHA